MRVITQNELRKIGGGLTKQPSKLPQLISKKPWEGYSPDVLPPVVTLPPVIVTGSGSGSSSSGGGGGAPSPQQPPGNGGGTTAPPAGTLSHSAQDGVNLVKADLGIDITSFVAASPTLAEELSYAVDSANWKFYFAQGSSNAAATDVSGISGTIHIDSNYEGNINDIVQQLSHELGHVEHWVYDDAKSVTSQQYIGDYLTGEGYAAMSNEAIRHEIITNMGIDVGEATGDTSGHAANYYEQEYENYVNVTGNLHDAAVAAGNTYGAYESSGGISYHQIYENYYVADGGTR